MVLTTVLWLAAMVACGLGETVTIGVTEYNMTQLDRTGAFARIVIDKDDILFYNRPPEQLLYIMNVNTRVSAKIEGQHNISVINDILMVSGTMWLATMDGIYTYDHTADSATGSAFKLISPLKNSFRLACNRNEIYVTQYITSKLYVLCTHTLHIVPGVEARAIAFNKEGDFFYTDGRSASVHRRTGGASGNPVTLKGIPRQGVVWQIEVDMSSGFVYVCHMLGLFYIRPGSDAGVRVAGVRGYLTGLGIASNGDLYSGSSLGMHKLSLLTSTADKGNLTRL